MSHFSSACKSRSRCRLTAGALVVPFLLFAGPAVEADAEIMPNFALVDTNSTSSTYGQLVSPRNYLQQVSAWYFGHAT
ncbi:MAG: hypothetical protein ACYSWU_01715 [Planctomycetota bacterium]|jgi:hypothetical protein